MHDRERPIPRANMQVGFIGALVLPLWSALAEPAFAAILDVREVLAGVRGNLARYKLQLEDERAERERREAVAGAARTSPAAAATP